MLNLFCNILSNIIINMISIFQLQENLDNSGDERGGDNSSYMDPTQEKV